MELKTKIVSLVNVFEKDVGEEDNIYISGYASTTSPDRAGDVVPSTVWNKGLENYLKNPVILAYHDHEKPVGRMVDSKVDSKGLWIKARISSASDEIFKLVKDSVLTAFSVSFRVMDAEYNAVLDLFVVKELELIEISVVSVPMNQDTLFSLSKSFKDDEEYKSFKLQFAPDSTSAKGLESSTEAKGVTPKGKQMDNTELQAVAKAAAEAAVALVTPSVTGAEKLVADLQKRFEDQDGKITGLEAALKEKADELKAMQASKMAFNATPTQVTAEEMKKAFLISKITGKSINDTKFGAELVQKYGAQVPSATWETSVGTTMENEIKAQLVVAAAIREIAQPTSVYVLPVNPESLLASWMSNTSFGAAASAGTSQASPFKEVTLNAYKVATNQYLAYEQEEDSLIVLMPFLYENMTRSVARAIDAGFINGAGAGADPLKGLARYDATSALNITTTSKLTVANLQTLRRELGVAGIVPNDLVYIVGSEGYFDLLEDTSFQTMEKVGAAATFLTGQIGVANGSPVLVSDQMSAKTGSSASGTTNYAALAVNVKNFISGSMRGTRIDTQDLVETQRKVLVASRRLSLAQISTSPNAGVAVARWS